MWLVVLLGFSILFIVVATTQLKLHPFLALLITAFGFGILSGMPLAELVESVNSGFGGTIGSIGIVILAGSIIGTAFFLMILFAALTSSISMLETMTARIFEIRGVSRTKAATMIGTATFLMGLVTVFSFSTWENYYPLANFETFATKTPFDLIDYAVTNILMPVGGMLYAILKGWEPEKWAQYGWACGALVVTLLTDHAQPADEEQIWSIWEGNARVKR